MRTKNLLSLGVAATALTFSLVACSSGSDDTASSNTASSTASPTATAMAASSVHRTGTFNGDNGKKVAGTVTIAGDTVTLAGFSSDEGPDLHLYLTNGTGESDVTSGTQIDAVAWNEASQTFTLPKGVDAGSFTTLVVHCDKAKAVFGSATLS